MTPKLPKKVTVSSQVLTQMLDGEMMIYHLQEEHYYGLDAIGTRMWQLLTENSDVSAVIKNLTTEYNVDESVLIKDLVNLIEQLSKAHLAIVDT